MNKKKSIIMSVALAASMLATSMSAFAYTDISADHWAKSYIDGLSGSKYISGYQDGTYKPDSYITRAEFAKILTNIFGVIDKSGVTLTDVADSAWYADTMKIAVKAGYITGYSDGTVRPEANITRQEAAVMVYRAWGLSPEGNVSFTDKNEIADWAANQIATLSAKNVIGGYSDGSFQPNKFITRAEVAKIISNAITLGINKVTTPVANGTTSGVLHVGATTSTGHVSGGGGGSHTGNPTGGNKDLPDVPKVDKGTTTKATAKVDTKNVVDAITAAEVAADAPVVLKIKENGKYAKVKISFRNPKTGNEVNDLTIEAFNDLMKELNLTKEQAAAVAGSLKVTVPDTVGADTVSLSLSLEDAAGNTVVDDTAAEASVNYVIASLQDFQNGYGDNYDLVVVVKSYTEGFEVNKTNANDWLKNKARKLKLYNDVAKKASKVFADVEVTEDNYKTYVTYFTTMLSVVDSAVDYVAGKKGEMTKEDALTYFNDTVVSKIEKTVSDKDAAAELVAVAKAFGADLVSDIDTINKAAKKGSSKSDKVAFILDAYEDIK